MYELIECIQSIQNIYIKRGLFQKGENQENKASNK